jgi:penicillin-binding protein 1B
MVRAQNGKDIYDNKKEERTVLDPRVAYLMTNLMEEVMRSGTAAGVRSRGFTVPAAGKTGTSHDGWFAGYTSSLLCIVWVGFDDNRQLDLEGAHSALPIWTEFMKRALQYRAYRNAQPFQAPDGIVSVQIDPESGMLATPLLSHHYIGSLHLRVAARNVVPAARRRAERHARGRLGNPRQCASGRRGRPTRAPRGRAAAGIRRAPAAARPTASGETAQKAEKPKEKKSLFRRLLGVFK